MTEYIPGEYETISRVNIRREPRILEGNLVGVLGTGTKRTVHSIFTDDDNQTWGRISAADASGIAQWICIQSINRQYAKRLQTPVYVPLPDVGLEERLSKVETELFRLIAWAKTQGYKG